MSVAKSTRERIALFVVLGLAFILLHNSASAALIEETAFSGLGYGDFKVVDADNGKCAEYVFLQARDLNYAEYALLSLHAEFGEGNTVISVYMNNEEDSLADLDAKEFKAGIARVHLPGEMLREKNTLRICVNSDGGAANAGVLSDSGIGYYTMPDFSMRGAFVKFIVPEKPKAGGEFEIKVTLLNAGSEAADVDVVYRRGTLEERMPVLVFVKGDNSFAGEVPACVKRDVNTNCVVPGHAEFSYFARTNNAGQMTLLPAILKYTSQFGEVVEIESNRQTIIVVQPEIRVRPFLLIENDVRKTGELEKVGIGLKNEGTETIYNISAKVFMKDDVMTYGEGTARIPSIAPGETIYTDWEFSAANAGEYEFGCVLNYLDYNVVETQCKTAKISYENQGVDPALIGGVVLVIVAVAVFLYFRSRMAVER